MSFVRVFVKKCPPVWKIMSPAVMIFLFVLPIQDACVSLHFQLSHSPQFYEYIQKLFSPYFKMSKIKNSVDSIQ